MADRTSMSFMEGFLGIQATAAKGNKQRVFDWDKAAEIIRERKPTRVEAGLTGDWDYTGGVIYRDGQIVDDAYTYLSSNWAVPKMILDEEDIDCWRYEDDTDGWGPDTKWPESARNILAGETA